MSSGDRHGSWGGPDSERPTLIHQMPYTTSQLYKSPIARYVAHNSARAIHGKEPRNKHCSRQTMLAAHQRFSHVDWTYPVGSVLRNGEECFAGKAQEVENSLGWALQHSESLNQSANDSWGLLYWLNNLYKIGKTVSGSVWHSFFCSVLEGPSKAVFFKFKVLQLRAHQYC